ncbi:2-iminoacetate synthase ThiH [Alteromonas sp. ASW11-130]|uniref:2-iminoacetate synthase ThiH n=1 Tax=Alteromonas sp. ASW11-130 TaxID=3015775 RepID=UPI002242732A|nr:2-iminoacetate synthase ThiH [Alteromonas sp. ASW11-130]MCW8091123.1 2-iminoacetate synthase ThiH [Alteromonas sp. ASW11-130]
MHVADSLKSLSWDDISLSIAAKRASDVEKALTISKPDLNDFLALVSPAAELYVEDMARKSVHLTRERFGNTVSFFIPLYLSNVCANECTYCGFTMSNRIKRKTLTLEEVALEARAIQQMGINSLLIVTGEHEKKVGMEYFRQVIPILKSYFDYLTMEVQPLTTQDYTELRTLGVNAILVYQETYHTRRYSLFHQRGNKTDFAFRLDTADRIGEAKMDKIGLGALLGLSDWRTDSVFVAAHAHAIQQQYWRSRVSIAFPRIQPCTGDLDDNLMKGPTDRQLVQLICAHRIVNPHAELTLSTRESANFRNNVIPLGITHISAASQTQPGGYGQPANTLKQFDTDDGRSVAQMKRVIHQLGLDPVFTDWLPGFS